MKSFPLVISILVLVSVGSSEASGSFTDILLGEVSYITQFYFSENENLDDSGFNNIGKDEFWSITELFQQQYGKFASTSRFVGAILDFRYFEPKNESINVDQLFTDVFQLIKVGEYKDARTTFAAAALNLVRHLADENLFIENENEASQLIRQRFISTYDVVGNADLFASFLNLKLGSSLSFVMDTTGSMAGEIEAAKKRVVDIVEHTAGTNSAPLNYVLVPYNDPGFGPVTKTSDSETFIDNVNLLGADGGEDEAELAMIGILLAAQNSNFRSIVYVFTDATAKDKNLQNHVIALCLTKKISVNIFLTSNISKRKKRALLVGRPLYDNVAQLTGGMVMLVDKRDIEEGTEVMKATTEQGLVMLESKAKTTETSIAVNVDSTVSDITVQFTGDFFYMGYTSSNPDDDATLVQLADITGVRLFKLEGVSPGTYTFNFDPDRNNEYGVLIRGKSGLGFHAHLSQKKRGTDTFVASRQLLAGADTRADLNVFGDAENVNFTTFQLQSRDGDVLLERPLMRLSFTEYVVSAPFDLPETPMFVRLTGYYDGMPLERVDPCAITPTVSESYLEDIEDIPVFAGDTVTVTTVLHNKGGDDIFIVRVSDIREFVSIDGGSDSELQFPLSDNGTRTLTLTITVPVGTAAGVLSKVLLSATGLTDNYFLFTTFVVSVKDTVKRCPIPTVPNGGTMRCSDDIFVGSSCVLECEEEYLLDGQGWMTCQEDERWNPIRPGTCILIGSQTCSVAGDPHYTTFDGRPFDFQGACLYTLLKTNNGSTVEPVTIQTENTQLHGNTQVSWWKQAFVTVYNITVHFKFGKIVLIDGIKVELPVYLNGGDLQIKLDGGDVLLLTRFKMEVRYNGGYWFRVALPARYIGQVSGLCGNYDNDMSNELMIGNTTFAPSEFGNHWEIVGGSNPWCRKGQSEDDDQDCNEAQNALYAERCSAILSDCFKDCENNQTKEGKFKACVFDMCATGGSEKVAEDAIAELAISCADEGFQICNWREEFDFPPFCDANSHYEFNANRCPNTCVDPNAAKRCVRMRRTEACVCNDGFVRDGTDCVKLSECGCAVQGRYYKKGDIRIRNRCKEKCECQNGVLTCTEFSCEEGRECRPQGDGRLGCSLAQVDQFYATGDPHYKTLDGSRYDFMGTCRYIMLATNNEMISDSDKHIVISAQNEYRGGNTHVSYVQAVYIEIMGYEIKLGPGTSLTVMRNGTEFENGELDGGIFYTKVIGRFTRFVTMSGITVKFDGTNLYIDVPSFYMHKVSGFCGNYTGVPDDDFGGQDITEFATGHEYGSDCNAEIPDPFVCSDEDKAKWGGTEYCGKLTDVTGPFQYCNAAIDMTGAFDNCVFDVCVNEGNSEILKQAIEAYAQECIDEDGPLNCAWRAELGFQYECPENSRFDGCASTCVDTCQNPSAVAKCQSGEEIGRCVCDLGYIVNNGVCVKEATCGCVFPDGTYHEQGYVQMEPHCAFKITCAGGNIYDIENNPCGETAKCVEKDEEYKCVPNEFAYALIYGGFHFKTFDDKHFDFRGSCGYLIAGHISSEDMPLLPTWSVFVTNKKTKAGDTQIEKVTVEVRSSMDSKHTITIDREKTVMIDGYRARFGTWTPLLGINFKRGMAVLDFAFGLHINFNGDDWVRVDVEDFYTERLYGLAGNFNENPDDDFLMGDIMRTAGQWGDLWYRERYSEKECDLVTPTDEIPCRFQDRFERSCDCGIIMDTDGPFAVCHEKMDPGPFMDSCVNSACLHDGSPWAIARVVKAYYLACIGKEIRVEGWREHLQIRMECPMYSHYEDCTGQCQPTCTEEEPDCPRLVCEEGCVCDEGYILSDGICVEKEKCGCKGITGYYYEHGACLTTGMNCTRKCTCIYGDWDCEENSCNMMQSCRMMNGELGCYWKDPCKYENGGCSDTCSHDEDFNAVCGCKAGRILTKDNVTCVDISRVFLDGCGNSCGTTFKIWKSQFQTWQNDYLPAWRKELEAYKKYIESGIVSGNMDVCNYEWTRWYNMNDPSGCGDEELLDMIRVENPEVCEKPIAAEGRLADGRSIGAVLGNVHVDRNGLVCKNADQEKGTRCPDFAVRFLCRVTVETVTCG